MDFPKLVEKAKSGDSMAFGALYEACLPIVKRICAKLIDDNDAINDIAQDAFVVALVSIKKLNDNDKFPQWVAGIASRLALKHLERLRHLQSIAPAELKTEFEYGDCGEPPLSLSELEQIISQLPDGYRKVFTLSIVEGRSHKEIAALLGIEPHSSSSQLLRAKRMLRKMLSARMAQVGALALLVAVALLKLMLSKEPNSDHGNAQIISKDKVGESSRNNPNRQSIKSSSPNAKAPLHIPVPTYSTTIAATDTCQGTVRDSVGAGKADDTYMANVPETDSAGSVPADTSQIFMPDINVNVAETAKVKHSGKWQLLAASSVGPGTFEGAYKTQIANDTPPAADATTGVVDNFKTWEQMHSYLMSIKHSGMGQDSIALIEISAQNNGQIIERERHLRPITISLAAAKSLDRHWRLETGVQYSLLKSDFTLGANNNCIARRQSVHYVGLPLRISYDWLPSQTWWGIYTSAGAVLNVPVYGQQARRYVTAGKVTYRNSSHFTPPFQWAVGASVGIQYRFMPKWSVYAEPTFNWYIPNGSNTHTYWTKHPFMFTMPLGIRYTW